MKLELLRDEAYAHENWTRLRPFYCRLSPELLWAEVRRQIVEELNEEIQANSSKSWEYATYFTYPTTEQMESIHEDGLFFSEIREIVGYRSAEALSLLAGLIRLEPDGEARVLLEESFANLWQKFAEYGYGHGYDTANTRADLVLMLASNNVFGLVQDRSWIDRMRAYFSTETHPWSGRPLRELRVDVLRALGEPGLTVEGGGENPIVSGVFDLEKDEHRLESLREALFWEQSRPEEFESAPPRSIFYLLPYHLVKFTGLEGCLGMVDGAREPFARTALHFLVSLCLRSKIVQDLGIRGVFTFREATEVCEGDRYAAVMTLGQMIKVGLVEFDTAAPWFKEDQQFRCREEAQLIL